MTARLLMDNNPIRIQDSDTIGIAARKIMRCRYRSLPVVDEKSGRLEGMISYYDIGERILQGGFNQAE